MMQIVQLLMGLAASRLLLSSLLLPVTGVAAYSFTLDFS